MSIKYLIPVHVKYLFNFTRFKIVVNYFKNRVTSKGLLR